MHNGRSTAPQLSVVIPCYNAGEMLATQLEALEAQEWSGTWEVIVADNGSTDDSQAVAERFRDRLPGLQVVDAARRRGCFFAYNEGVRASQGSMLAFCDADDEIAPGWLAAMVAALSDAPVVGGRFDGKKLNQDWVAASRQLPQQDGVQPGYPPLYLPHVGSGNMAVRRDAFEALGGFREDMTIFGDTDFCWRAQLAGFDLGFAVDAVLHVRLRSDLRSMYRQAKSYGEAEVDLYVLHQPRLLRTSQLLTQLIKVTFLTWPRVVSDVLAVRHRSDLAKVSWSMGWRVGRIRGNWRNRQKLGRERVAAQPRRRARRDRSVRSDVPVLSQVRAVLATDQLAGRPAMQSGSPTADI